MKSTYFSSFSMSLLLIACSSSSMNDIKENPQSVDVSKEISETVTISSLVDSSSIVVTVERGAFHYDRFVMKDTLITFYPAGEGFEIENDKYDQISKRIVSKQLRNELIKEIIEGNFFDLDTLYSSGTTCNSHLTVTVEFNNQSKKVISEDFERGCPDLLKHVEQKIIEMHKQNLVRIILPG